MNENVLDGYATGNDDIGHSVTSPRLSRRAALRHIGLASGAGLLSLTRVGGILRGAAASEFANSGHNELAGAIANAPYQCDRRFRGGRLSPDGRWWLVGWPGDWESLGILPGSAIISADGKAILPLSSLRSSVPFWGNDSHNLYCIEWSKSEIKTRIWASDIGSPATKRLLTEPFVYSNLGQLCPSADGSHLAFSWFDPTKSKTASRLCLLNNATGVKQVVPGVICLGPSRDVQWPRESENVLCLGYPAEDKPGGIFVVDPGKGQVSDFTEMPGDYFSASPSGDKAALIDSNGARPANLNLLSIRDMSGQILFQTIRDSFSPSMFWSADGMRLFVSYMTFYKGSSIGMIDLSTGSFTDIATYVEIGGQVAEVRALCRDDLYFATWSVAGLSTSFAPPQLMRVYVQG